MKSLNQYITEKLKVSKKQNADIENFTKFENEIYNAETLEELICIFYSLEKIEDMTESDFNSYDAAFYWFGDDFYDLTLNEFIKKIKSFKNYPIENLEFHHNNKMTDSFTFKCNGIDFDIEYVEQN